MKAFFAGLSRHPSGLISLGIIVLLVALAVSVHLVPHFDPKAMTDDVMVGPSLAHLFGTDELGRSVADGLLAGIQVSLAVGFFAAFGATVLGVVIGASAGFYGGWLDGLTMRIAEFFQVIPSFILAALIVAMVGPGLPQIVLVVALLSWPQVARVMRGEVMRVKQLEFVDAVRCLGLRERHVLAGEVVPNAIAPVLAVGTLIIAQAILLEASLSFLGLGDPELISWGRMLNSGQRFLFNAWWLSLFPGVAIFVTVLVFNLLGDAVNDVLNPRKKR
ncbi:ABC transporter permease [Paraburkholderia humisilvae]|uniref:Glutathione transport system permease protein GsiD n=1 Tax=Paraburkholderia humisilvae TaxID=627669 RepID=A0A6J5F5S6_9BURK|nr:ABC transporter permease [Paraburkholderia humisilvae]CAB3773713.1 Glutathione transport system permease protein GsiD [Paraburkholderia humisilvae]